MFGAYRVSGFRNYINRLHLNPLSKKLPKQLPMAARKERFSGLKGLRGTSQCLNITRELRERQRERERYIHIYIYIYIHV